MMKKQILTITVLAAMFLSGCGTTYGSTASSEDHATTTAVSTIATATEQSKTSVTTTAVSQQAANASELGQIIFGGYVTGDAAVKKSPAADAQTLLTIPSGTQINVYESGTNGWFMTEFKDAIGYIDANIVADIEPVNPSLLDQTEGGYIATDSATVSLMSGTHAYAKVLAEIPVETQVNYSPYLGDKAWCIVPFQDHVGYVESKYIKDLDSFDMAFDTEIANSFIGHWQYDRCSIVINEQGTDFHVTIHWADSASEDNIWTYDCTLSDDNTRLECTEGGTLVHVTTAEDKTETRTEVYHDGTAVFTKKGGTLFWQEGKEDRARQLGFERIE